MLSMWKRYWKGELDFWTELLVSSLLVLAALLMIVGAFAVKACWLVQ